MNNEKLKKDEWVYVSDTKAKFAGGKKENIYQYGKVIGHGFSYVCSVEIFSDGSIYVNVDDDEATYTSGSYTSTHIPSEVILTLIRNNQKKCKTENL
jgi:hypothetical protein